MVVTATDAEVPSSTPAGASDSFAALYRPPVAATPVSPRSPLTVLFTSGTTSRPKGVLWTHANGLWGARLGALQEALGEDDVHFVFLPLFHVVALSWSILPTLWAGGSAVLVPRFSASRFWDTALAWRCTFASMVPFCTAALARQAVPERHHFRTWGHAIYSSDYERRFRVRLLGWWGMTEIVSQGIVGDFALPQTPGTIGRPSVAYPLEVVDDEGHAVEAGATGELRVHGRRGLSLFGEYLDDPEATREAFDAAGRFRTGDRVRVREGGAIEFVDRAKDVIRVGGEGVAAPEIERVISALAGVREVAVVARRHPLLGEEPVAFVRLDDGRVEAPAVVEAILTACRDQLAKFKVPREVRLVEEFPRAAIGKISKAELRRRLAEGA
jgi:crotonobetaine/carnitine-CoA ligase